MGNPRNRLPVAPILGFFEDFLLDFKQLSNQQQAEEILKRVQFLYNQGYDE